jgi:hypothetical protein
MVGKERTDEVYCQSWSGRTWFRLEILILFLMEHLHCMASLVPRDDFCFCFSFGAFPLFQVGSGRD